LKKYLIKSKIVPYICIESIRTALRKGGLTLKNAQKWMISRDPQFNIKKRIEQLLDYRPPKSRVICFDEKGSIVIKTYPGRSWSEKIPKIPAKQSVKGKTELLGA